MNVSFHLKSNSGAEGTTTKKMVEFGSNYILEDADELLLRLFPGCNEKIKVKIKIEAETESESEIEIKLDLT